MLVLAMQFSRGAGIGATAATADADGRSEGPRTGTPVGGSRALLQNGTEDGRLAQLERREDEPTTDDGDRTTD